MLLVVILLTLPFLQTANTTPLNRMTCIKDIVTIVGGSCIWATLWKLVNDYKSGEDEGSCSDIPRMPSSHLFQPRAEEMRDLKEKFNTLEKTNLGDLVSRYTSQGTLPVVRLSWLDSLGENSSPGTSTRIRSYLLGH